MSCGSYLLESMSTDLIRSGMLAHFPFIQKNKYIFRYFFNLHSELDIFGVFKCNFSGRYNNTFKLVVGHVQYFFHQNPFWS